MRKRLFGYARKQQQKYGEGASRGMLGAPFLAHCAPFIYLIISLINQKGAQGAGLFLVFFGVVSDNIKSMAYSYRQRSKRLFQIFIIAWKRTERFGMNNIIAFLIFIKENKNEFYIMILY